MPSDARTASGPLWIVGYGAWPTSIRAERLVTALVQRGVTRLVDVRLNPCASDIREGRYGPKPWTLQSGSAGIAGLLRSAKIAYEWLVELGNPQRHDKTMTVLREHLANPADGWPVHRGLDRLAELVSSPGEVVALLCACADDQQCHRTLIARALVNRCGDRGLTIRDVRTGREVERREPARQ